MAVFDSRKKILFVHSVIWDLVIPQEAATVLYEDNDACTAMGNAHKATPCTQHIKYVSIYEWVDRELMHLERIDTSINISDHFSKALSRALFHRHVDFILGHVPPMYSPVYHAIDGMYTDQTTAFELFVPKSFTTPICSTAARVHAPLPEDYVENPWRTIVLYGMVSPIHHDHDIIDCGGVLQ